MKSSCPVCDLPLRSATPDGIRDAVVYNCPRCGRFKLTRTAEVDIKRPLQDDPRRRFLLSHYLRKMQQSADQPMVLSETCDQIFETCRLPTAKEQADNTIRWLGSTLDAPGASLSLSEAEHGGIIGTVGDRGFRFIVEELFKVDLIEGTIGTTLSSPTLATLSFQGWERYEELRQGAPSGRTAFMAMQFGDAQLDQILRDVFRPAVADTGFNLARLDDVPKAGLIDDRLRVEIRACRFLIADLTHANLGAYWEAGYAEGLGKPVIYTCERKRFKDKKKGPHFDTNHHLTVLWSGDDLHRAGTDLKATIRASIPEAAQQEKAPPKRG